MSRTRVYESAAQRQAAYRLRRKCIGDDATASAGQSAAAARSQWLNCLRVALIALSSAQVQMECYYALRSQGWQDGELGVRHAERTQSVIEAIDMLRDALEA